MREKQSYRDNLAVLDRRFPESVVLTMREAAAVLGVDYRTLCRHREHMPFVKIGNKYYISKADMARVISA